MKNIIILSLIFMVSCATPNKPITPEKKQEPPKKIEPIKDPEPIRVPPSKSYLAEEQRQKEELERKQQEEIARIKKQKEEFLAQQKAIEEAKKAEQERIAKEAEEALNKRYGVFIETRNSLITTLEAILPKLKYETTNIEYELTELNKQITGRKNKIDEIKKQIENNKNALASLPKEGTGVKCPNLMCNKYTSTGSTLVTECPYCGTTLQRKTSNVQRQEINNRITLLNKSLQFEIQNMNKVSTVEIENKLELYRNTQNNISANINNLKQTINIPEAEAKQGIERLEQLISMSQELLTSYKTMIPNFKELTIVKAEPETPKKIYKLKNGDVIEVKSEMITDNEIILKTMEGKILTLKKEDILP